MLESEVILVADDREEDVMLLRQAMVKAQVANPVQVVNDGEQTIRYLNGEDQYSDRAIYPLPGLLLLDLKMPRKDGFEVLQWIRQQPNLSNLRVIMLTTSDAAFDLDRAYQLGANSFLVKPMGFPELVEMIRTLKTYWFSFNLVPKTLPPAADKTKPLA